MKAIIYARFLSLPFLVVLGYMLGGWWNFITPITCFVIHPLINLLPQKNIQAKTINEPDPPGAYRFIEMIYVPVLLGLSIWGLVKSSEAESLVSFTGLAISIGLVNGILGFTLAHELIHRRNKKEQFAGYLLLLNNLYMHYGIEHIWGHHVYASTPKDPHTARFGESLYRFLPRAVTGTFANACAIEQKKLRRSGKPWLSPNNRVIVFVLLELSMILLVYLLLGMASVSFLLLQSLTAVFLLHAVNYLQHYGLMRQEVHPGQVEKMTPHHAWNSGNRINSLSLFQIENHAHHHLHPTHPFEELEPMEGSPRHPTGYSGMIMLALFPPLWFRIVHKRICLIN